MKIKNKDIKIGDIFYLLFRGWRTILSITIICFILSLIIPGANFVRSELSKKYKINSSVAIIAQTKDGKFTAKTDDPILDDITAANDIMDTALYVMQSDRVIEAAIEKTGVKGINPGTVKKNLTMDRVEETQAIEMTLTWGSESEGILLMNAVIKASDSVLLDTLKVGKVSVVDSPKSTVITRSVSMNVLVYAIIAGVVLGVLWCVFRFIMRPTIINIHDPEDRFGLKVFGSAEDDAAFGESNPLSTEISPAKKSLAYATHVILNQLEESNIRSLYFTAAEHGEGTSRIVSEIAFQLAEMGNKVLLIDCNFKKPSVGALFKSKLNPENTLNAVYNGDIYLNDAITKVTGCLSVLPAELEENPPALDEVMLELLKGAMDGYDYVLFDAAPVGDDAEMLKLNKITDAALFVISFDRVSVESLGFAVERLEESGALAFGCVVNFEQDFRTAAKKHQRYYKNAHKRRKKKNKEKKK